MPLIKSSSPEAIAKNIRTESKTKPHRQAVAIAMDVARRAKATGGDVLKGFKPHSMKPPLGATLAPITTGVPKAKKAPGPSKMPRLPKIGRGLNVSRTDAKMAGFAPGGAPAPEAGASGDVLVGPVVSSVPGRTDRHPVNVLSGSYVLPSSHVASLGEENTLAGLKVLGEMFPSSVQSDLEEVSGGDQMARDRGGYVVDGAEGDLVPIIIAGGEFVVHPKDVAEIGGGDIARGHKELDKWVLSRRKKQIKTLQKLAPPAKD